VQHGCCSQCPRWRERQGFGLEQVFEGNPQGVAKKGHEHVRLRGVLDLVKDGAHGQFAFQRAEGGFGVGELDVTLPEMFRIRSGQVGAQQIGAFTRLLPVAAVLLKFPSELQTSPVFDYLSSYRSATCGWRAWIAPTRRSILPRSQSLPSATRLASADNAFSMRCEKRLRIAFSFSWRAVEWHRI